MRELILLIAICAALVCNTSALLDSVEQHVLEECLERYGGLTYENAKRLERFASWSDYYEEIPCFTQCYLQKMFDIYNATTGFNARNVIKKFGQPLYNACQEKLEQREGNPCQLAYNGLHCLVNMENDPLILIESMTNITIEARSAMKHCLVQVDQSLWPRISEYAAYPVKEPIPCFTQCFVTKLQLYNRRTRTWNVQRMRTMLGIPPAHANTNGCQVHQNRNYCLTIYQKFTCMALAK